MLLYLFAAHLFSIVITVFHAITVGEKLAESPLFFRQLL